jgi:hypothetical protein
MYSSVQSATSVTMEQLVELMLVLQSWHPSFTHDTILIGDKSIASVHELSEREKFLLRELIAASIGHLFRHSSELSN